MKRKVFIWVGTAILAGAALIGGGLWGYQKWQTNKLKESIPYKILYMGRGRADSAYYGEGKYIAKTDTQAAELFKKLPTLEPIEAPKYIQTNKYTFVALIGNDQGSSRYELSQLYKAKNKAILMLNNAQCSKGGLGARYIIVIAFESMQAEEFRLKSKLIDCPVGAPAT